MWIYYIFALAILALPVLIIVSMFQRGKEGICTSCGFQGKAKMQTRGSFAMEIVLWLAFIIPGLIYSIWRLTSKKEVCPSCDQPTMIPRESPRGRQLVQEYNSAKIKAG